MKKLSVNFTKAERIGGWIYMLIQLLVLPTALLRLNQLLGSPLDKAEVNFLYFCLNFLFVTVIFRRYLLGCAKAALDRPGRVLAAIVIGLGAYWFLNYLVSVLILKLYPAFSNVNDASIDAMADMNYPLITIGTVLLVPVVEEVLFRGLIFRGLYNRSRFLAYAVSTVAFCLPHVVSYIGQYSPMHLTMCFIQYIPAGLCLGWAYGWSDTVWAPILMHTIINLIGIHIMR